MITKLLQGQDRLRVCGWIAACVLTTTAMAAQTPAARIRSEINNVAVTPLKASQQQLGSIQFDAGRMPSDARLTGMSIVFNRSAAQEADLQSLIAAQQDPHSPQYHQWLSPEQYGARFGMAQADLDKVQTWLQQQGFSIDSVARGRNMIRFSGTAGQVEQAFQTQMHYFKSNGKTNFSPATLLSVPSAIAPTIAAVRNLSDFKPRPMHVSTHRAFTSSQSGNVFFAPGDIAVTYDINPLYSAGVNGTGQSIAIVGQSAVLTSDIEAFENAAGLPVKDPVMVLVPNSGSSTVVSGGDEGESDLDIEWSGAIAKGATIDFVYTGNAGTLNAFDALAYAIDEKIAPIISVSYGACETALNGYSVETQLAQAAVQGQTVLAASGDQGSTACSGDTTDNLTTAQQFAIAVNYPASSQYVTGVGGTEISAADDLSTNSTYWVGQGSSDVSTSAKTYIPEIAWNDDSTQFGLGASGGGASALFARPSWQTGVTGIPSGTQRLVPDVSLYSSAEYPGYLFCTSDQSDWNTTTAPLQQASCNSTFRDGATGDLTVAGGTSFATPIFAGMIALINQKQSWTDGQGLANPTLYKLAAGANYSSLFHDVTSGNNNCTAGATYCGTTTTGFSAGTGYDEVTGLGSVDLTNLAGAWPTSTTTLVATTTTVSAASAAPTAGVNDLITITVAEASGTATPTGTVNLSIDGGGTTYSNGGTTTSVTLTANGTATYTANFTTAGAHTIVAQYAGDTANAASTGSVVVTVGGTSSGKGTFTMAFSPATLTVSQGSQGSEGLTITPSGGYTGTVNLTYNTSNNTALANLCVFAGSGTNSNGSITVASATAVTGQITIDTNASDCASSTGGALKGRGLRVIPHTTGSLKASNSSPKRNNPIPAGIAFAGLVLAGFLGRSSRKLRQLACVIALASLGLVLSACGGSSSSGSTISNPAKGTYTITFAGDDSVTSTITAQSSFSLVIQ